MKVSVTPVLRRAAPFILATLLALAGATVLAPPALAQAGALTDSAQLQAPVHRPGGEANLVIPDLSSVNFLGINGRSLLMAGLLVCFAGLLFGLIIYRQLKNMPVHASMREVSELIYETCKTYLITQGKFILILELFMGS